MTDPRLGAGRRLDRHHAGWVFQGSDPDRLRVRGRGARALVVGGGGARSRGQSDRAGEQRVAHSRDGLSDPLGRGRPAVPPGRLGDGEGPRGAQARLPQSAPRRGAGGCGRGCGSRCAPGDRGSDVARTRRHRGAVGACWRGFRRHGLGEGDGRRPALRRPRRRRRPATRPEPDRRTETRAAGRAYRAGPGSAPLRGSDTRDVGARVRCRRFRRRHR